MPDPHATPDRAAIVARARYERGEGIVAHEGGRVLAWDELGELLKSVLVADAALYIDIIEADRG